MPIYLYYCDHCHTETETQTRGDRYQCSNCAQPARRIFLANIKASMQDHYNPTTGQYVRNENHFKDQLKVMSDTATERTGVEHHFVPTDPTDMKANGVTEEGLKETYDAADPDARKILDKYI